MNMISKIGPVFLAGISVGGVVAGTAYKLYRKDLRVALVLGAYSGVAVTFSLLVIRAVVNLVKACISSKTPDKKRLSLELAEAEEKYHQETNPKYERCLATYNNSALSQEQRDVALKELQTLLGTFEPEENDKRALKLFNVRILHYQDLLSKDTKNKNSPHTHIQLYTCILSTIGNKYYEYARKMALNQQETRAHELYLVAAHWLDTPTQLSNEISSAVNFCKCVVRRCNLDKEHKDTLEQVLIDASSGKMSKWKENFSLIKGIWYLQCYEQNSMKTEEDVKKASEDLVASRNQLTQANQSDPVTQAVLKKLPATAETVKERKE